MCSSRSGGFFHVFLMTLLGCVPFVHDAIDDDGAVSTPATRVIVTAMLRDHIMAATKRI